MTHNVVKQHSVIEAFVVHDPGYDTVVEKHFVVSTIIIVLFTVCFKYFKTCLVNIVII